MTEISGREITNALDESKREYVAANPTSELFHRQSSAVLPGGSTRATLYYSPFPLRFRKAEGRTLTSVDGDEYVDLLGEYTAGLYGHSNPFIKEAIFSAVENGVSFGGHNTMEGELAEILCSKFPSLDLVRYTNSGTEANIMALMAATAFTGRDLILVFKGGYHGGVLSFGSGSDFNLPFHFLVGSYNDTSAAAAMIESYGVNLAAVIVEPMQGSGGCIPADPEFLATLREHTSKYGALLVFDEVMTSRLAPGGLQSLLNIKPDISTFGKYLGGGMSFGAFGGRREIMQRFDPSETGSWSVGGTFNNNVVSLAAGIAGLTKVLDEGTVATLNARGERLRIRLNEIFEQNNTPFQATGYGSMLNIHATRGAIKNVDDLAHSCDCAKELLFFDLLKQGFWIAKRGMIALSVSVTERDCEQFIRAIRSILQDRKPVLSSLSASLDCL